MFNNIVFWLDFPLFHISPLIKSLSQENINVIVICENPIPKYRLDMGFTTPDFGNATLYFEPSDDERRDLVFNNSCVNTAHVFHGLRGTKKNFKSFKKLVNNKCSVGLYFEYLPTNKRIKLFLRRFYYKLFFLKNKNKIDFMLALGETGKANYIDLGFPRNKIFAYNYFIEDSYPSLERNIIKKNSSDIKILFVGTLNETKNVMLLINSFNELAELYDNISITFIGEGELKKDLNKYIKIHNLSNKVRILPYVSNIDLKVFYLDHDFFVLPSRWDGWGVVAVEAIANGLPVVISNTCGSSSIIKEKYHGVVFKSLSLSSLVSSLKFVLDNADYYFNSENKEKRIRYALDTLSANAGKDKILKILSSVYKLKNLD